MYQGFDHRSCIEQLAQLKSKAEDILNRLDHLIRKGALDSSPLLQKFRRTFSETEKRLVKGFPADPDHVKLSTKEKYAKAELQHNSKPFMVQLWPFYSLLQEVHGFHLQARRFLFDLDSLCNSFSVHAWGLMQLFMDVVVRLIQMHHLAAQGPWPLLLQVYTLLHRYSNDGQNPSSRDALTLLVSEHYQALVPWLQASFQPLTRRIHQVIEMVCLPAMPLVLDASHPSSSCHLLQALAASSGTEPQPAAGSAAGGKTDALLEWPRPVLLHTEQIEEWLVLGLLICPEAGLDAQVLEALGRVLSQRLRLGLYRGGSLALHQQFAAHVVPGLLKAARKQPSRSLRGPKDLGKLLKSLVPSALAQAQAQAAAYHCRQMSFLQRQLEGLLQWCENQAGDLARVVPQLMAALHRSWREVQWCFRHMEHCTATLRGQAAMTWPGGAAAPEVLCCALLDRMVGCIGLLDVWRSGLRVSAMQEALHKLEASVLPSLEVGSRMLADQPESAHGGAAGVQAAEAALSELWSCMSAAQSHVRTCLSSLQALRPGTETRQPEGPSVAAEGGSQAEGGREDDDSSDDGVRDSGARWERPAALMLPEDEGEHDGSFGARVVQGSSFWLRRGAAGPLAAAEVAAVLDGGDGAAWSPERASQLRWEWRVGELRLVARCRGPDGRDVLLQGSFHQQLQLDRVLPALCEQPEVLLDCQEAVELLETAAHGPAEVARRRWAPLHDLACWPAAVRAVLQKALESGPRSCAAAVCLVHVHACPPHDTPEPAAVPPKPAAAPKPPKLPAGSAAGASEQATTAAGSVMLARQRTQQALEILDVLAGTLARLLQEAHEALKTKAQWVTLPWEAAAFAATSSAAAAPAGAGSGAPRLAWPGFAAGRNRAGKEAGLARLSPGLESCPGRSGVTLSLLADRLQSAAALLQSLDAASPVHVGADTAVQPRSAIPAALRLAAAGVLNRLAFGCGSRGGGRGGGRGAAGGADAALGALAGGGWELPPPSALAQELRLLLHMLLQLDQQVPGADLQMYAKEHLLGLSSPCSGCDAAEPPGLQELLGEPGSRGLCQEYVSWYIHAAVLDTAQLGATLSPTLRCFLAAEGGAADALLRQHTGIGELSCFAAVFGMGGVRLLAAATHAVLRDTLPDLLDACSQAAAEPATKGKPALRGGGSGARQNVKSVVSRAAAAPEPQAAAVVAQLARCLGLRAALAEAALAALSQHAPVLSTAVAAMHSGAAAAAAAPAASTPHSATQPSDLVAAWPLDLHEDRAGGPPAGAKPLQDAAQLPPARPPDMNGSGSSAQQQATASTSVPFLPSLWQQLNLPEPAGALVSAPSRSAGSGSGTGGRAAAAAGSAQTPRSSGRRADPALVQILAAQGPGTMHVMVTSLARLAAAHPFSSSSAEHVVWNSGTGTASNGAHLLSVCMEAFAAALSALPLRPFPSDPALLASPDAAAATAAPAAAPSSLQAVFEAAVGHALVQQDASNAALRALSEQLALSCSSS